MLAASRERAGNGQQAMKCPECEVLLTRETLRVDMVLVRKIRRIEEQERREREGGASDDEDEDDVRAPGGARRKVEEVITSSPARSRTQQVVKSERMSGVERGQQASREPSMVPATQMVELEEGEDEGDEGEETE
ncbi:MAG: hypothetical protein L6R39_006383 [Caloplaca ligustica]|nr:MAG: hypothetical protein L6R39_006383 [Caloplaca ligustica]